MTYSLIYYPKCSTCVKGLALLRENNIEPNLITYMADGLSIEEIGEIARKVGSAKAIIREKTALEKGILLNQTEPALIEAIAQDLNLLQRPILIKGQHAVVGRPIEAMLEHFPKMPRRPNNVCPWN